MGKFGLRGGTCTLPLFRSTASSGLWPPFCSHDLVLDRHKASQWAQRIWVRCEPREPQYGRGWKVDKEMKQGDR
jgi:hypothetical protein